MFKSLFGIRVKLLDYLKRFEFFFNAALNTRFLTNGLKLFYEVHIQSRNPFSMWPLK